MTAGPTSTPPIRRPSLPAGTARPVRVRQGAQGDRKAPWCPGCLLGQGDRREASPGDTANGQGRPLELPDVEPWDQPSMAPR